MLSNECRERWSIGQGRKARFNKCRPGRLLLPRSMKLSSPLGETDPSNVASVLVVSSLTNHGIQRLLKALGQNGNEVEKYGPDLALVMDAPIIANVRGAMMSAAASDFESLQFSSEDLCPTDRIPFYTDVIAKLLARFDIEPVGERFSCNAGFYRLPNLSIAYMAGSAVRAHRTREMAEGCHELVLVMGREGTCTFSQGGREVVVPACGAVLLSAAEPCRSERTTTSRISCVGIPRAELTPMLANPDAALMSVIPSNVEPLRLLAGYVDLLTKDVTLETAELRRLAVSHVHDLVALTLGATRDAAETAAGRGLRAARLRAIKADIAQNLDSDVSVAALAMRHRVTPRYIRKLFEGEGTSLSRFVRGQRLMHVHRMLADRRHADRAICDIAFAAGFGDLSTFNRDFRRRFGMTPSDVRAAARSGII
jgi:AraC-like DNA-binding protein